MNTVALLLVVAGISLILYLVVPGRWQNSLLLLSSYVFVFLLSPSFLVALIVMTGIAYLAFKGIRAHRWYSGWIFRLTLVAIVGFLLGFRFMGIAHGSPGILTMVQSSERLQQMLWFPLGLSFYSLQAISILVDTHRGYWKTDAGFVDFALYLAYFPKFLAGPIERHVDFLPQLSHPRVLKNRDWEEGFTLIVLGLFRKVGVADILREGVPSAFLTEPQAYHMTELWFFLIMTFAIFYFDFSGYTNIARGISRLFGIQISANFDRPFSSVQLWEFWNRWHMSLSHWIRDYVYFPLTRFMLRISGGKVLPENTVLPVIVAMIVSAVWHGLALNFWIWGVLMGCIMGLERLWTVRKRGNRLEEKGVYRRVLGVLRTWVLLVAIGIPFLVQGHHLDVFVGELFQLDGGWKLNPRLLIFLLPGIVLEIWQTRSGDELVPLRQPRWQRVVMLTVAAIWIILASQLHLPKPFIYQGF